MNTTEILKALKAAMARLVAERKKQKRGSAQWENLNKEVRKARDLVSIFEVLQITDGDQPKERNEPEEERLSSANKTV